MENKKLTGKLATGLGKAAGFMEVEWAHLAFSEILGEAPFPGTVNVILNSNRDLMVWNCIKSSKGQLIEPPDPEWCNSFCYKAKISGKITAAVILPDVDDYAVDQVELIAALNVRNTLFLKDGDQIEIEILSV